MPNLLVRLKDACLDTLRPPPGLTTAQVRKNGAVAAGLGVVLVALTAGAPMLLDRLPLRSGAVPRALIALMLLPWGLFVIGGYRLVTGKGVEQTRYGAGPSINRILIGVGVVIGSMAALFLLFLVVGFLLGLK
jgi:hypothetical protein